MVSQRPKLKSPPAGKGPQAPIPRPPPSLFVLAASLLALLVVLFGAFVTVAGGAGTIEISGLGVVIKAETGGMALIAFALIFYLAIGKLINDLHG